MKCTICGGRSLPGAKLCSPCRAALRRARDETITEFLPLPKRLEAMAISGISTLSRPIDFIAERRAKRRARKAAAVPSIDVTLKRRKYPPLYGAAIVLFVLSIGVLAYGFARQLRGEPAPLVAIETPHAAVAQRPSISPTAQAAEARNIVLPVTSTADVVPDAVDEKAPPLVVDAPSPKPRKVAVASAIRPTAKVEAPTTTPVEVVPMVAVAAPPPPATKAAPDRWQLLATALAHCGGSLFARIGCEHSARGQYCDGYWGQVAQCPGGVSNDHGQ